MKNKLAIGLGLALGLTSGLCSADSIPLNVSAVEISPPILEVSIQVRLLQILFMILPVMHTIFIIKVTHK